MESKLVRDQNGLLTRLQQRCCVVRVHCSPPVWMMKRPGCRHRLESGWCQKWHVGRDRPSSANLEGEADKRAATASKTDCTLTGV